MVLAQTDALEGARADFVGLLNTPTLPSATLDVASFKSSANGAFGRHDRHDRAGMRLVTAASG